MTETIADQIDALQRMTTSELVERFAELHGYPCRTRHRAYLIRKIAWRIQANAEGDLTERARRRAAELADDAVVYDEVDQGYDAELVGTGVLALDVTDRVGLYVEGIGIVSTDSDSEFLGILGFGAICGLGADVQLDAGVNIGLTGSADEVNVFSGITVRF